MEMSELQKQEVSQIVEEKFTGFEQSVQGMLNNF